MGSLSETCNDPSNFISKRALALLLFCCGCLFVCLFVLRKTKKNTIQYDKIPKHVSSTKIPLFSTLFTCSHVMFH